MQWVNCGYDVYKGENNLKCNRFFVNKLIHRGAKRRILSKNFCDFLFILKLRLKLGMMLKSITAIINNEVSHHVK